MAYLALARKYRPQTFSEVLSQSFITSTLQNAINLNRVSHAYLFTGPRGVGKTSTARIFAKALNCLDSQNGAPCGVCENCQEIVSGSSLDVIEIDGASNRGVDEIRSLREAVKFVPVKSKYKVIIVDEVHMLTEVAFNALLKTLEEPPEFVIFIFATTDQHKIPATILSRCQRYEFKKIAYEEMLENLKNILSIEKVEYEEDALNFVIRNSDGCMRDALSILDQIIAYSDGKITKEDTAYLLGVTDNNISQDIFASILKEEPATLPAFIESIDEKGLDYKYMAECLIEHCRNMLFYAVTGSLPRKDITSEETAYYEELKKYGTLNRMYALFQIFQKLVNDLKYCDFTRYVFEFATFKAASLSNIIPLTTSYIQEVSSGASAPVKSSPVTPVMENKVSAPVHTEKKAEPQKIEATVKETAQADNIDHAGSSKSVWNRVMNLVSAKNIMMFEQLKHAKVLIDKEERISLEFPAERSFQYKNFVQGKIRDELLTILKVVTGMNTALEVHIEKQGEDKKKVVNTLSNNDETMENKGKVIEKAVPENYNTRQLKNSLTPLMKDFVQSVSNQLDGEIEDIQKY